MSFEPDQPKLYKIYKESEAELQELFAETEYTVKIERIEDADKYYLDGACDGYIGKCVARSMCTDEKHLEFKVFFYPISAADAHVVIGRVEQILPKRIIVTRQFGQNPIFPEGPLQKLTNWLNEKMPTHLKFPYHKQNGL